MNEKLLKYLDTWIFRNNGKIVKIEKSYRNDYVVIVETFKDGTTSYTVDTLDEAENIVLKNMEKTNDK